MPTTTPPDGSTAVALVRAHLRGDGPAIHALIDSAGCYELFAVTVGYLVQALVAACGGSAERVDEVLAHELERYARESLGE